MSDTQIIERKPALLCLTKAGRVAKVAATTPARRVK
jgi:hypothetical protein